MKVISKQPDVIVSRHGVKYGFAYEPTEIPDDFAEELIKNPMFEKYEEEE